MPESYFSYYLVSSILTALAQLSILIICLFLLIKEKSWASIFLFTGSLLIALGSIMGTVGMAIVGSNGDPETLLQYQSITNILNAIFYVIFALGLILLVLKYINRTQNLKASPSH